MKCKCCCGTELKNKSPRYRYVRGHAPKHKWNPKKKYSSCLNCGGAIPEGKYKYCSWECNKKFEYKKMIEKKLNRVLRN
jgi:predicted nucleic acid-binding Zn ribbon protein